MLWSGLDVRQDCGAKVELQIRTSTRMNLHDGKLFRLQRKEGRKSEADDKQRQSGEVETAKDK